MSIVCIRCGARVENAVAHDEFHRDVDRALGVLPVVAQLIDLVGRLNDALDARCRVVGRLSGSVTREVDVS